MIEIQQTTTEQDYRRAAMVHYKTYWHTRFYPFTGTAFLVMGGVLIWRGSLWIAIFSIVYGIYILFFTQRFWANRLIQGMCSQGSLWMDSHVVVRDNGEISIDGPDSQLDGTLDEFYGYIRCRAGLMLYLQKKEFFLIIDNGFLQGSMDQLQQQLNDAGVKRLL